MEVTIMETGETKELLYMVDGQEFTVDLLELGDELFIDPETGCYFLSTEAEFLWWENYFTAKMADTLCIENLIATHGLSSDAVYRESARRLLSKSMDMNTEHDVWQSLIDDIKADKTPYLPK